MTRKILPVIFKIVDSRWSGPKILVLIYFFRIRDIVHPLCLLLKEVKNNNNNNIAVADIEQYRYNNFYSLIIILSSSIWKLQV